MEIEEMIKQGMVRTLGDRPKIFILTKKHIEKCNNISLAELLWNYTAWLRDQDAILWDYYIKKSGRKIKYLQNLKIKSYNDREYLYKLKKEIRKVLYCKADIDYYQIKRKTVDERLIYEKQKEESLTVENKEMLNNLLKLIEGQLERLRSNCKLFIKSDAERNRKYVDETLVKETINSVIKENEFEPIDIQFTVENQK